MTYFVSGERKTLINRHDTWTNKTRLVVRPHFFHVISWSWFSSHGLCVAESLTLVRCRVRVQTWRHVDVISRCAGWWRLVWSQWRKTVWLYKMAAWSFGPLPAAAHGAQSLPTIRSPGEYTVLGGAVLLVMLPVCLSVCLSDRTMVLSHLHCAHVYTFEFRNWRKCGLCTAIK